MWNLNKNESIMKKSKVNQSMSKGKEWIKYV